MHRDLTLPLLTTGAIPGLLAGVSGLTTAFAMVIFVPAVLAVLVTTATIALWYAVRKQRAGWAAIAGAAAFGLAHWPFSTGLLPTLLGRAHSQPYALWVMGTMVLVGLVIAPGPIALMRSRSPGVRPLTSVAADDAADVF